MVFSSLPFLLFFLPAVLLGAHVLPRGWRNGFLLIANLFFYAYGEPVYVLLMLFSILLNYTAGVLMERLSGRKKAVMVTAVVVDIALLCVFKYTGLVTDTLRHIPALAGLPEVTLPLPIGISFYTFQAVSYVVDVYRGDCRATGNFVNFAAYISLFPQLIAGPIVRYSDVYDQLEYRTETLSGFSVGVRLFVIGLAKKVLLANQLGLLWEQTAADPAAVGTLGLWMGAAACSLQIYFGFSGYSDMARGLGKMLGFDFCINFNYPYISRTVTEFWRRWHMSLSSWFRDYVYIPLGGNRRGQVRMCMNILIVWMLTGLWHGAGWNFLFWGLYYGVLLLIEKLFLGKYLQKLPAAVGHIYTMLIVMIGWVFFASNTLGDAFVYIRLMFTPAAGSANTVLPWLGTILAGAVCSLPVGQRLWVRWKDKPVMPVLEAAACLLALLLCTACLVSDSYNPFLYFRF